MGRCPPSTVDAWRLGACTALAERAHDERSEETLHTISGICLLSAVIDLPKATHIANLASNQPEHMLGCSGLPSAAGKLTATPIESQRSTYRARTVESPIRYMVKSSNKPVLFASLGRTI